MTLGSSVWEIKKRWDHDSILVVNAKSPARPECLPPDLLPGIFFRRFPLQLVARAPRSAGSIFYTIFLASSISSLTTKLFSCSTVELQSRRRPTVADPKSSIAPTSSTVTLGSSVWEIKKRWDHDSILVVNAKSPARPECLPPDLLPGNFFRRFPLQLVARAPRSLLSGKYLLYNISSLFDLVVDD